MEVSHDEIVYTLRGIKEDSFHLTPKQMDEKYATFKEKFPRLYQMAPLIKDWGEFEYMMKLRGDIKDGKKSEIQANIQLGEYMGKKYIYPKTGEPTQNDKKRAINKIIDRSINLQK